MNKFNRRSLLVLLIALLTLPIMSNATAAQAPPARIVAIGDSVTVGYEVGLSEKSVPYGYVERVYEQALFHGRAELSNYAVLGLTTPGLISLLKGAQEGRKMTANDLDQDFSVYADGRIAAFANDIAAKAPDIAASLDKASLVVMTVGGNDFGDFIKQVLKASDNTAATKLIDEQFDPTLETYLANLRKLIPQIRGMAPGAEIVLADQYLPLWSEHELYDKLLASVTKLSAELDALALEMKGQNIPLRIVHLYDKFAGKAEKYTYIKSILMDNHPTQAGYDAIGRAFADELWGQYLQPAPKAKDVPISIIINGKQLVSKPTIVKNTTFLPFREVAAAVGASIQWVQKEETVIFRKDGKEVAIKVGAKKMTVNGVEQPLDTPAYYVKEGKIQKTYVPLAVITSGLDYQVVYRQKLQTAFINS